MTRKQQHQNNGVNSLNHLMLCSAIIVLFAGCDAGQKDPSDRDSTGSSASGASGGGASSTTGSALTVPRIDLALPAPSGLNLAASEDILSKYVDRVNQQIEKLNEDVDKMNSDRFFADATTFKNGGPDGTRSGTLAKISDGTYDYAAVVCEGGKVSTITKWSIDGTHISSERDLNQKPKTPENVRVKTVYSAGVSKSITMQFYGTPNGLPADADGSLAAHWDEAVQLADGSFTVRGVGDYFNEGEALVPDDYITGSITPAGLGEFVGWSKRVGRCDDVPALSEADPINDFCNSRLIGGPNFYSREEAAAAWTERLSKIGVAAAIDLGNPEVSAICPE